jgi:hypothetical protein
MQVYRLNKCGATAMKTRCSWQAIWQDFVAVIDGKHDWKTAAL